MALFLKSICYKLTMTSTELLHSLSFYCLNFAHRIQNLSTGKDLSISRSALRETKVSLHPVANNANAREL